ncbi:MAG: guanylate kinase [Clostridia bacterium]|nr:guanylate kinase [Clostridia bacterium]
MDIPCRKGRLIVLSGPSGVGKGTIGSRLIAESNDLCFSVSATTRPMREGEVDGVNYYFKTIDEFQRMIDNGEFLEYMNVFGRNYYGTPRAFVEEKLNSGISVLLDIDVNGAMVVKDNYPEAVMIFIAPPSLAELHRRLVGRGTDTPEAIERRFGEAKSELALLHKYDYVVVNDDLELAVQDVFGILRTTALSDPVRMQELFELLNSEPV